MWQVVFWLPLWMACAVVVASVVSTFADRLDGQIVLFSLLCAALPIVIAAPRQACFPDLGRPGIWGWLSIGAFVLVALRLFSWGMVEAAGSIKVLLPNNLGDASLHLALINFLSASPSFWPMSPWFAPAPLSYPLGTDFFDAMMGVLLSRPPLESIAATSLLMAATIAALMWGWSRAFGVALLLFCAPLSDLLLLVGKVPEESSWKSLMLTVLAPQRGMLVALPLGLAFLVMARRLCAGTQPAINRWLPTTLTFLPLAPLPLFSVHAAVALVPVAIWTAMMAGRRAMLVLAGICVFAMIPLAWLLGLFSRAGHMRIEAFSCKPWDMAAPICLLENFGLLLPLLVWLLVQGVRNLTSPQSRRAGRTWEHIASVYFPTLFLLSLFVAISPWVWDNTKLMLWAVVGAAPFVWSEVLARFPSWFRTFSVALLILPGVGSLQNTLGPSRHGYEIARASEVREAMAARHAVPAGSVLAAAPDYNHPWFLAGHAFFLGYEGWLWSHGLDSSKKRQVLSSVLSGEQGWDEMARENGITHIVWTEREEKMSGKKTSAAPLHWPVVFRGKTATVYAAPTLPRP